MAVRRCGICERALREDDGWHLLRIKEGDRPDTKIGLYHACADCEDDLRKSIAKHRPKTVEVLEPLVGGGVKKKTRKKKAEELTQRDML